MLAMSRALATDPSLLVARRDLHRSRADHRRPALRDRSPARATKASRFSWSSSSPKPRSPSPTTPPSSPTVRSPTSATPRHRRRSVRRLSRRGRVAGLPQGVSMTTATSDIGFDADDSTSRQRRLTRAISSLRTRTQRHRRRPRPAVHRLDRRAARPGLHLPRMVGRVAHAQRVRADPVFDQRRHARARPRVQRRVRLLRLLDDAARARDASRHRRDTRRARTHRGVAVPAAPTRRHS